MKETTKCDWVFWRQTVLRDGVVPYSFQCGGRHHDGAHSLSGGNSVGVDCERRLFPESACIEWTLGLRNTGAEDTALLSELRSLDLALSPPADGGKTTIHAVRGCGNGDQPFALERLIPERGKTWRIGNPGGGKTGWYGRADRAERRRCLPSGLQRGARRLLGRARRARPHWYG